jgi:hypothetical protein
MSDNPTITTKARNAAIFAPFLVVFMGVIVPSLADFSTALQSA